ncbi:MAG TPA: hypothetical protein PLJ48_07225, partial [Dermatophilaceae bacterium]|nr:hypothetical protein [Dermatophilaceae bacterium]
MAITPIDLADDALMSRMYAVVSAVRVFERPHFVSPPEASAIGDLRHVDERIALPDPPQVGALPLVDVPQIADRGRFGRTH